jgi:hypothetical protein
MKREDVKALEDYLAELRSSLERKWPLPNPFDVGRRKLDDPSSG